MILPTVYVLASVSLMMTPSIDLPSRVFTTTSDPTYKVQGCVSVYLTWHKWKKYYKIFNKIYLKISFDNIISESSCCVVFVLDLTSLVKKKALKWSRNYYFTTRWNLHFGRKTHSLSTNLAFNMLLYSFNTSFTKCSSVFSTNFSAYS